MEKRLNPDEACRLIAEELGIERSRVRPCFDEFGTRICCLVHESWIQRYATGVPSQDWVATPVSPWSPYEHQLLLQPSHPGPAAPWLRVSIQIVRKPVRKALPATERFSDVLGSGLGDVNYNGSSDLSFAELMQNVGAMLFRHSCDSALETFPLAALSGVSASNVKPSDKNVIEDVLSQAYNLPVVKLFSQAETEAGVEQAGKETDYFDEVKEPSEGPPSLETMKKNVVPFVCALEGKTAYFLVEPYFQHSLHDIVTFSPSVLSSSHVRPLFVIYELLHSLQWYHSHRLAHGALTLEKLKVSKGLWIYLQAPDFVDSVGSDPIPFESQQTDHDDLNRSESELDGIACSTCKSRPELNRDEALASKWTSDDLPCLVQQWVHGEISNYDYLIALNYLAGRHLGDPNYHTVFPWVTDFSLPDGRYRDLTKSKFRLNKGDRQLDVTYKAAWLDNQDGISSATPHHVSDVLSDITYHVYLARRTPKSVLCDHVRTHWVPNEYPSSMERLYHWTPDECIPQFFSDPAIFDSIHADLPDLEVPSWTASPEEFVQWHRRMLESEMVSLNLHHWIDLTFGYKLGGKEAVKAKNVYLHLIDKHQSLSNHGVLQLFTAPHPQKSLQYLPYTSMFVSDGDVQQLVDGKPRAFSTSLEGSHALRLLEESVTSVDSVSDSDLLMKAQTLLSSMKSIENVQDGSGKPAALPGIKEGGSEEEGLKGALFEPISIPCNYNPLNLLEKFEALGKFKSQFGPRTEVVPGSIKCQSKKETDFGRLVQRDMASLGCIIVEMLLAEKVRLATSGLTGRDREKVIAKLCVSNEKLLPRYARAGVRALLKELMTPSEDDTASHDDDDEKLNAWLPPLTPDLLLQPHMGLFPFPSYFSALYEFLAAFYHSGRTLEANSQDAKAQQDWHLLCLRSEDGNAYSVEQVDTAASFLPDLLAKVDEEGIKLLLCHLEPLFTCQKTRLLACTQLFDMLAQALGPKNTVKTFLKCLMSLFDSHTLENYESIARQHFLSQIIVRFGLDGFLKHFISFVVDAVAFKSMMATGSQNGSRLSSFRRTLEAVVPGFSASDRGFSDKERVPMDMDDDLTTDLPSDFLRGASEEQEDELNYSITVDDVENSGGIFGEENTTENLQDLDEVRDSTREKEVSEQVTLMPRGADVDEGDRMLFLQNNLSDDDDDEEGVGDDTGGRRGLVDVGLRTNDANDGNTKDDEVGDDDFGGIVFDNVKSDHSLVDGHGAADGGDDVGNDDSNDSQDKERQSGADTSGPELEPNEKETVLKSDERHDHADGSDWQLRQVGRVGQEVGKEEAGLKQGLTECIQKKTVYSLQIDKVEGEGTKERVEDVGGRDLEEDVGQNNGEDEEQRHSVGENSLEEISGQGDGGPGSQDEEAFDMKEDEEGDDDDDDDDDENGDDEGDEEDNKDHVDQSGDISSQTPVAYEVQTFYNGSETKACLKEEKTEREQNELTPGAISGIAAESIVWLAPRLGPVLTSKYIASQLLTMLPHCYIGHVGCADGNEEKVVNDRNAKWLLFCLGNFCTLYGEAFMLYQYLPYIEKTVKSVQNKVTPRSEAALAGVLSLLKYCIPYLSRDTLQNYCESELMKEVFQPVIRVLSSYTMSFPGGVAARQAICRSYIDVLTVVCLKLERELARENMTAALQQFFSCFELESMRRIADKGESQTTAQRTVESSDGLEGEEEKDATDAEYEDGRKADLEALYSSPVYDELCHTFSAAIAHHAFVPLCGIMGSKYMESALYNHDLIWNLCCSHDAQLSHPTCEDTRTSEDDDDTLPQGDRDGNSEQTFEGALEVNSAPAVHHGEKLEGEKSHEMKKCLKEGFEKLKGKHKPPMWFIGRRLSRQKDVPPKLTPSSSSDQYLRGSWLEHWENQLNLKGKVGNNFNLQQVKLQTFTGHSGAVRSLYVQDSEHFFLSASKDKTVKLWSLSNHGDGTAQSASSWTYYRHSRPVFHVGMVESVRQAVSCDGSLHLWDPVSGRCLGIFEPARNNPVVAMTTLPAPGQCVVAAMAEGTARFLDVRQHSFVQEWKVTTSNLAGTVRDICCSPDGRWIALGFSSGLASVLDIRGGLLRSQRRAHTSDIFQVKAFSNNSFVTSSVDQGLSLWKDDGLRMKILKGHSDPLPSLLVWRDQVISASVGGRVGVHNLQEEQSETSYFSYKLSGDVFRGGVTCLGYLPLNRLLLIGSDTGNISLCS